MGCGFRLQREPGSGLLESVYEVVLAKMLEDEDVSVRRQVSVPIEVFGQNLRAFVSSCEAIRRPFRTRFLAFRGHPRPL